MQSKWNDQTGRTIILNRPPKTVISLVPSITETLIHCCNPGQVIGRTKFCIHPHEVVHNIPSIGGTKHIRIKEVYSLIPDIIIANKEENTREDVALLAEKHPVYVSEILNTNSLLEFLNHMAEIFNNKSFYELSEAIIHKRENFKPLKSHIRVAYLIWRRPYMTVGGDTFINHMIEEAGLINVFCYKERYPEVTMEEIMNHNPDFILLSSEPYPFKKKHIDEMDVNYNRNQIRIVDGEIFSWYGVRNLKAYDYFKELHSEL